MCRLRRPAPRQTGVIMNRMSAFFAASWLAAALLYFGQHSLPVTAVAGVVLLAGFDLFRP
uniref:Uncharacterized protein n=3 Tax=Ralstonia TaxID=48736 RepID=C6BLZ9_RALP1